jgi:hypothetical protein
LWSHDVPYSYWGGVTIELPGNNIFFDITSPSNQIVRPVENPKRSVVRASIEELVIISLVLVVFLSRIPSFFIPFTAIPIVVMVALVPVLGGIAVAIGLMIDAMVLMFGQGGKRLESGDKGGRPDIRGAVISAVKRINRPSFFVVVAVAISFLPMFTPQDKLDARVVEVTRQQPTQPVWELCISGQESYRTVHLPSLYPEVQW